MLFFASTACRSPRAPFYPIGIYSVPTTNDLTTVRQAGFNLVVGTASPAYLDAARRRGIKVLASPGSSAGPGFSAATVRRTVAEFDSHPALWAWYLIDEPDLNQVSPQDVRNAHRFLKNQGAHKPTAIVLYQGSSAFDYAGIADILMIDRYPVPWLPLANFPQHVWMARLGLGPKKPLIAVIQAFDWSYHRDLLPEEKDLRPPTYEELRCMTYCALARRANGIIYYAFQSGGWNIEQHPEVWDALRKTVSEVHERLPLFQAQHQWRPFAHRFKDPTIRFNAALESSITPALLRVRVGDAQVPAGDYVLAVNNTAKTHHYGFHLSKSSDRPVSVFGEERVVRPQGGWVEDEFGPYAVHVYGPLPK